MNATAPDIQTAVLEVIRARGGSTAIEPAPGLALGSSGLGLDSIAIAEVLLECEQRFGVTLADLLDGEALTVGRLIERVQARLEQKSAS